MHIHFIFHIYLLFIMILQTRTSKGGKRMLSWCAQPYIWSAIWNGMIIYSLLHDNMTDYFNVILQFCLKQNTEHIDYWHSENANEIWIMYMLLPSLGFYEFSSQQYCLASFELYFATVSLNSLCHRRTIRRYKIWLYLEKGILCEHSHCVTFIPLCNYLCFHVSLNMFLSFWLAISPWQT